MDLEVKDVVELLNVSEEILEQWVAEGKIPSYLINQQHRFSRMEIEDWILQRADTLPTASAAHSGTHHFCLYRALHQGDILTDVEGHTKEEVIHAAVQKIAPSLDVDPEVLCELLLDREQMMSTGLGHGIAVPHTRDFLRKAPLDRIFVAYPQIPLAYGSLDQQPVHTLFFLFASHDKGHLQLLAKLAHLASHAEATALLKQRPAKKEWLDFIRHWEN